MEEPMVVVPTPGPPGQGAAPNATSPTTSLARATTTTTSRGFPIVVSNLSYSVVVGSCLPPTLQQLVPVPDAPPLGATKSTKGIQLTASLTYVKSEKPLGAHRSITVNVGGTGGSLAPNFKLPSIRGHVKRVLNDVSFTAYPGQVLAVVGSSGAGKSTVLDALAGRIQQRSLEGDVLVSGYPTGSRGYKRLIGYVMQDDALFAMLTPRETLMLSASLRLPSSISTEEKAEKVEQLLIELGLQHVADSRIGDADVRGISGGEKRRVSIGTDLVHDPPVLLLDEPTSGLDSHAALNVLEVLRRMATLQNRTIVLSIHQPSFRILEQIDRILLMGKGRLTYCGSLPRLETCLDNIGCPVPMRMNALEYAIELLQNPPEGMAALEFQALLQSANENVLKEKELGVSVSVRVDPSNQHQGALEEQEEEEEEKRGNFATTPWNEVAQLVGRNLKVMLRTRELCLVRAFQVLLCAVGLGTVFLNVGFDTQGIQSRMGFMAFSMAFLLTSSVEALPLFLKERQVFVRETARGAYRLSSYQFASILVFLPFLLVLAILFSVGSYFLVGLYPSLDAFCFFVLTVWAALLCANSLVALFAAMAPDFITANSLISGLMGMYFLFSGFFITKKNIPSYWIWVYHLSIFKYPMEALLINEYGQDPTMEYGLLDGSQIMNNFGLTDQSKWAELGILVAFAVMYRVLCYFALLAHGTTRR